MSNVCMLVLLPPFVHISLIQLWNVRGFARAHARTHTQMSVHGRPAYDTLALELYPECYL